MSMKIREGAQPGMTREELLALNPNPDYDSFFEVEEDGSRGIPLKDHVADVRTDQSFKDSSDVNKIVKRHQIKVANSHLQQFPEEFYGEFADYDLLEAHNKIEKINAAFDKLPSEVKNDFAHDPFAFARFVTDPAGS